MINYKYWREREQQPIAYTRLTFTGGAVYTDMVILAQKANILDFKVVMEEMAREKNVKR